jgi:hypothetical protein
MSLADTSQGPLSEMVRAPSSGIGIPPILLVVADLNLNPYLVSFSDI